MLFVQQQLQTGSVCHPLISTFTVSKGLSNPQLLLILGIQIWVLVVHQEIGSVHFD